MPDGWWSGPWDRKVTRAAAPGRPFVDRRKQRRRRSGK